MLNSDCVWGCTDSGVMDLARISGKTVLDIDELLRLAHRLCHFWLIWAQAVMIFHQICRIVLPLDPETAHTRPSGDMVRHKPEKEKGQTLISEDLSSVAPPTIEMLNLWNDFRKVVKFIDENPWVKPMLERIVENKKTEG